VSLGAVLKMILLTFFSTQVIIMDLMNSKVKTQNCTDFILKKEFDAQEPLIRTPLTPINCALTFDTDV